MSLIKAALIATTLSHPHGVDIEITPTESMADCYSLRTAVALATAPIEEFQIADDGTWSTSSWANKEIGPLKLSYTLELKCKPVGKQD